MHNKRTCHSLSVYASSNECPAFFCSVTKSWKKSVMIQLGNGWYLSCLLSFLPVYPFGFKLNNNPVPATPLQENNGQGDWNFLCWKYHKGKDTERWMQIGHESHPAWYRSCFIFQVGVWSSLTYFNGNSTQRGYPDGWMNVKPGNFHKDEKKALYLHIWGFYLTSLSLTSNSVVYLVFRAILWLWSWNITCSTVGRKHIGNQGQYCLFP